MAYALFLLNVCYFISFLKNVQAQASNSMPLPPLQWLNITALLSGPFPPALMDAAMAYDDSSRSIILFGGETAAGFAQDQTYLLNLDTLTWSVPSPPSNLNASPPPRSAAVAGPDFASSYRHGFVVIGGKDSDGNPLSDVWEFDFVSQFWSQVDISPGGPSARWGAAGGIDTRLPGVSDPPLPAANNSFYYAGGFGSTQPNPLSDVWRLNISGTLSSNNIQSISGSWESIQLNTLPPRINLASTMVSQQVVAMGGCTDNSANDSCALPDTFIINTQSLKVQSPQSCPVARKSAVLVPNLSTASSSFASQVFLLLGTFNGSLWQDGGDLTKGEVDVLDTNSGLWSRVLPAGDPGSSGNISYPTPREGSSTISFNTALVGQSRSSSSDTLIFGGRDTSGKYLSDVWILRAYSGVVTPSNSTWTGFGDGQLQTGINAAGTGVRNQIIDECATQIGSGTTSSSSTSSTSSAGSSGPTSLPVSPPSTITTFDTSLSHKLFAPLSIALFLPAVLLYRSSSSSYNNHAPSGVATYLSFILTFIAYGMGVAGIATSFTTVSTTTSTLSRRTPVSSLILKTNHGKAGLALFIGLYGVVPIIKMASVVYQRWCHVSKDDLAAEPRYSAEKLGLAVSPSQSVHSPSRSGSPRPRTHSWGPSSLFRVSHEGRVSDDSESNISSGPQRTFEVLNRPPRRPSDRLAIPDDSQRSASRGLTEVDWLQRRRSLNAVGELDYAITQALRSQQPPSTPATTDALVSQLPTTSHTQLPSALNIFLRLFFHGLLIGLCILSIIALWVGASQALFAIFLVWVVAFYIILLALAMNGRPANSVMTIIFLQLRNPPIQQTEDIPPSSPNQDQQYPFPAVGPYTHHQPLFRPGTSISHDGLRSDDDDDDEEDEDTRQRRIEDEMGRRDVSIITVPRRKLRITNPS